MDVIPDHRLNESETRRLCILLEELSILNEAEEYHAAGYGKYHTIEQLKDGLVSAYNHYLDMNRLPQAYDIIDMVIPEIVADITTSDAKSRFLSTKERQTLTDLLAYAKRQVNLHNYPGGFVIIG